ncbi:hypothetical protein [Prevotella melaninogenica]|uniref:hypothetical protein n=1 Tax=Prevotella melaninogenica TaxID=28132 RepID=UPI00243052CC|nr:hypothetical protein [Prevotella melaninogenica]
MKNYLKPYTACTKVEMESHLLSGSGGGYNGGFTPGCPPCPPPSTGQSKSGWGSVKAGTPSPAAKEDYFTNFED